MTNQPAAPISAMTAADIVSELRRCDHVLTSRIVTLLDSLAEITPTLESAASMLERTYTGPDVAGMARSVREMAGVTEPDQRDAEIERLKAELTQARDFWRREYARATIVIAQAREALAPFAKAGELYGPRDGGYDMLVYGPAAGKEYHIVGDDLRRARQALATIDAISNAAQPDPRDALLARARDVMQTAADTIDALEGAAGYERRRSSEVREVVAAIDGARGGAES